MELLLLAQSQERERERQTKELERVQREREHEREQVRERERKREQERERELERERERERERFEKERFERVQELKQISRPQDGTLPACNQGPEVVKLSAVEPEVEMTVDNVTAEGTQREINSLWHHPDHNISAEAIQKLRDIGVATLNDMEYLEDSDLDGLRFLILPSEHSADPTSASNHHLDCVKMLTCRLRVNTCSLKVIDRKKISKIRSGVETRISAAPSAPNLEEQEVPVAVRMQTLPTFGVATDDKRKDKPTIATDDGSVD